MIKLYGFSISNFYCIAKHSLLEKGIAFEEVSVMPNQSADYLAKSPMGKVPALETEAGCLSETSVILEYLEDLKPSPNLYPADPFARAKVRQLIKTVELYVESPAHAMIMALFGSEIPEQQRADARQIMQRGLAALRSLAKFSPWICGSEFTHADIFTYYSLSVASSLGGKLYDWDVVGEVPGLQAWRERMSQRPITQKIDAENQAALKSFMQKQAGG